MSILEDIRGLGERIAERVKAIDEQTAALTAERAKLLKMQRVLWKGSGDATVARARVSTEEQLPAVVAAMKAGHSTPKEICRAVHGDNTSAHKQRVQHVLAALVNTGGARRGDRGTYTLTAKGNREPAPAAGGR